MANFSPEPISNIGLSLGGDALVLGGLGLLLWHPIVALVVAIVALGLTWTFLPSLLRSVRATLWLAWRKILAVTQGPTDCRTNCRRRFAARCTVRAQRSRWPRLASSAQDQPGQKEFSDGWSGSATAGYFS